MTFLEAMERGVDENGRINETPHKNVMSLEPTKMLFSRANYTIMAVFQKIYEMSGLVPVVFDDFSLSGPGYALRFYPISDFVCSPPGKILLPFTKYEYRFSDGSTSYSVCTEEGECMSYRFFQTIFKMMSGLKIATGNLDDKIVFEFPEFNTPRELLMKLELIDYGEIS